MGSPRKSNYLEYLLQLLTAIRTLLSSLTSMNIRKLLPGKLKEKIIGLGWGLPNEVHRNKLPSAALKLHSRVDCWPILLQSGNLKFEILQ